MEVWDIYAIQCESVSFRNVFNIFSDCRLQVFVLFPEARFSYDINLQYGNVI